MILRLVELKNLVIFVYCTSVQILNVNSASRNLFEKSLVKINTLLALKLAFSVEPEPGL